MDDPSAASSSAPGSSAPLDEEDNSAFVRECANELRAGQTYRSSDTIFDTIQKAQEQARGSLYGPFQDSGEWELAKWLMKNVGHNQAEAFLHLPIVSCSLLFKGCILTVALKIQDRLDSSYINKDNLYTAIDGLPQGTEWKSQSITVTGDLKGIDDIVMVEKLELWYRDPVECVRELIGNPMFRNKISYAPEQHFQDLAGERQIWNEMWTGEWWWNTQVSISDAACMRSD